MLKILNRETQKALEANAMQGIGALTEEELVEKMANAFCMQYRRDFNIPTGSRMVIFAGPNRIGATALYSAAILAGIGYAVEAVVLSPKNELPTVVRQAMEKVRESRVPLIEVSGDFRPPKMDETTIVLDGICGLDLPDGPFTGSLAAVCRFINSRKPVVISLDIPSGLHAEDNTGNHFDNVIRAKHTYTFHGPKIAFLFEENAPYVGEWHLLNIGLDNGKTEKSIRHYLVEYSDMEGIIKPRKRFSNKYAYGRVLLIAGSKGMLGAAILAARAAYRSGVGHLTLAVPEGMANVVHTALPEALVVEGSLPEDLASFDAIAIGPGIGRDEEAHDRVTAAVLGAKGKLILDADALFSLAKDSELLEALPEGTILTPHTGEFDRIFGPFETGSQRIAKAEEVARNRRLYILLKGPYTAIVTPITPVIFNCTGNPGLATAGTGDVLTGMVLAGAGKGIGAFEICLTSAFIHGYAADLYCTDFQAESLMASDIADYLPRAMKPFAEEPFTPIY